MTFTALDDRDEEAPDIPEPRFSLSLQRGLAILSCYSHEQALLGVAELAAMLGLRRSTTHRYVSTLAALGYLSQDANRKYRLSCDLTRLGLEAMNATSIADHAHPFLLELAQRTPFATVSVAVLDGPFLIYVDQLRGARWHPQPTQDPVERSPHNTALGKLLLSYLPVDVRREIVGQLTLAKTGPNTITSKKCLNQELSEIRNEDGLVKANEELAPHVGEVVAPLRNGSDEVVAAVGVATTAKIDVITLVREFGPHLVVTADRISARLGYRRAMHQS